MAQANSNNSTRRRDFLTLAAAAATAAMAQPSMASPATVAVSDPVFDMIAAHKQIMGTVEGLAAEINRTVEIDKQAALEQGVFSEQNSAEFDMFIELTEAVPTTLAGVVALVTYLDEVNKKDPWKFEDGSATPLIGSLATAFNRMAARS